MESDTENPSARPLETPPIVSPALSPTSHLPPTTDGQHDSKPLTYRDLKQEAGVEEDDDNNHRHQQQHEEQNANLDAGAEMESADVDNAKSQT